MIYEVRYSELAGTYYVRQMTTGLVIKDSYFKKPENAVMRAVSLSGFQTADEWTKAVKKIKEANKGAEGGDV